MSRRFIVLIMAISAIHTVTVSANPLSPQSQPATAASPVAIELLLLDGGRLKAWIVDRDVTMKTPYGELRVPVQDILGIECATNRVTPEIEANVKDLGNPNFKKRQRAKAALLNAGEGAYFSLLEAAKDVDAEVHNNAEELVKFYKEQLPADRHCPRCKDIIATPEARFVGTLGQPSVRIFTTQFGEKEVNWQHVRSIEFRK